MQMYGNMRKCYIFVPILPIPTKPILEGWMIAIVQHYMDRDDGEEGHTHTLQLLSLYSNVGYNG